MKKKVGGARRGSQAQPQGSHCSHQNLGRGRGRNCEYQRSQRVAVLQPVMSIISSLLVGIQRLAHSSQQKMVMLSRRSDLISSDSLEATNPVLEFEPQEEGRKQLEANKEQLTTNNEKTQTTIVRQK